MGIVKKIRDFVESECKNSTSKYGREPFEFHFIPVAKYAEELANELKADKEVVLLAAWLHDIGSIVNGRGEHHITGAKIAEEKLKEFGYPLERIELIKGCILNHRGSRQDSRESLEEKIIAEADAISTFDAIAGLFKAALVYEGKTQDEARKSVRQKLENKWNQLHLENSKRIVRPKFEAAMLLLK